MKRGRLLVLSGLAVVAAGIVAALVILALVPSTAGVGPLPAEGLLLPADSLVVAGIDVPRLTSSPIYHEYLKGQRPRLLEELEERTGLDLERDLEELVLAGKSLSLAGSDGLALALGRLDAEKLTATLQEKGLPGDSPAGTSLFVLPSNSPSAQTTLGLLGDRGLALGPRPQVESALLAWQEGRRPLEGNAGLIGLLEQVAPGSAVWLVADQRALAGLPKALPSPAVGIPGMSLPELEGLVVGGQLDPVIALRVTALTPDEAAAQKLADVLRGLGTLLTLQASQRPELKELGSAVSVTTEESRVHLSLRIAPETLEQLGPLLARIDS